MYDTRAGGEIHFRPEYLLPQTSQVYGAVARILCAANLTLGISSDVVSEVALTNRFRAVLGSQAEIPRWFAEYSCSNARVHGRDKPQNNLAHKRVSLLDKTKATFSVVNAIKVKESLKKRSAVDSSLGKSVRLGRESKEVGRCRFLSGLQDKRIRESATSRQPLTITSHGRPPSLKPLIITYHLSLWSNIREIEAPLLVPLALLRHFMSSRTEND